MNAPLRSPQPWLANVDRREEWPVPDLLEAAILKNLHEVAAHVLQQLRDAGEPVDYRDYMFAMIERGFTKGQAQDAFYEFSHRLNADMSIRFRD